MRRRPPFHHCAAGSTPFPSQMCGRQRLLNIYCKIKRTYAPALDRHSILPSRSGVPSAGFRPPLRSAVATSEPSRCCLFFFLLGRLEAPSPASSSRFTLPLRRSKIAPPHLRPRRGSWRRRGAPWWFAGPYVLACEPGTHRWS